MATTYPDAVDATDCDREPIHIPGAIQPHGLLLVADADHRVVAGAGDIEGRLAPEWLGADLAALLGQDLSPLLNSLPAGPNAATPSPVEGTTERFTATLHRSGPHLLAELEPVGDEPMTAAATLAWLDAIAAGFERASDLQALCARAAVAFRTLTGFDRVMIYRFLDDDAGRVVAEDRDPALGTFLHHHFPATDIPRQARALYIRNRTRAIPAVDYAPAPLRPQGFAGVDLSDVAVRSVSPIHLRYLANMGVEASASISIVKDGLLWGLVACHHSRPRLLPADARRAAAALAGGLARQIRAKEEAEAYRERLRLRRTEDNVAPRINSEQPLTTVVAAVADDLRGMMAADGLALVVGGRVQCDGHCPEPELVVDLARWVRARGGEPFATHELPALHPPAGAAAAAAAGVLALPLEDEEAMLLWFRAEQVEEVEWAGNPHKAVQAAPGEMLTPRASFESWTETVRGRSRRVQNSLQLVSAFLRLQARAAGDGIVADHLAEAQARLAAVALVHRRLYRDDQVESVDLSRYLGELVDDMKTSLGAEWGSRMTLDFAPILVPTDRAIDLGLILTELVINATKYAYGGAAGPLSIALEQHRNRLRLIVADEGQGKGKADGEGFGSRMMTAMVQRLGGTLDHDDNDPGLRTILTAPIEPS